MSQDIECVFQGFGNMGAIYISNYKAASNIQLLKRLQIKAIISAAKSSILSHSFKDIPYYLYLQAEDHQQYDISIHFNKTFQFIENSRKQTNVLVHCYAGVSRSVSIVIAYLMKKYNESFQNVFTMIKRKRKKINPNSGFVKQLQKYSNSIQSKNMSDNNKKRSISTPKSGSLSYYKKSTFKHLKQNQSNKRVFIQKNNNKIFTFPDEQQSSQKNQASRNRTQIQQKIKEFRQQFVKMSKLQRKSSEIFQLNELILKKFDSSSKSAMLQRVKRIKENKQIQQDISTIPSNQSQKE